MKIFISIPMNKRKKKEIEADIALCKAYMQKLDMDAEFVDNYIIHHKLSAKVHSPSLYYLGEALQKLAECDALVIPYGVDLDIYHGCATEVFVANAYRIPVFYAD